MKREWKSVRKSVSIFILNVWERTLDIYKKMVIDFQAYPASYSTLNIILNQDISPFVLAVTFLGCFPFANVAPHLPRVSSSHLSPSLQGWGREKEKRGRDLMVEKLYLPNETSSPPLATFLGDGNYSWRTESQLSNV